MIATLPDPTKFVDRQDQLPPACIEAEESVLGALLLDPEAFNRIREKLVAEAFSIQAHQKIYRAICKIREAGRPSDLMQVTIYLGDRGELEKIGGQFKLAQLFDRCITSATIEAHADLIIDKWKRRKLIAVGDKIARLAHDPIGLDEAIAVAEEAIAKVDESHISTKQALIDRVMAIRELESPVEQWFAWEKLSRETRKSKRTLMQLAMAAESDRQLVSYSAAEFADLAIANQPFLIHGLIRKGAVALIAAEAKVGKSLYCYNLAYQVATGESWGDFLIDRPHKTLIVQTDETLVECQERIVSRGLSELDNVEIISDFSSFQLARLRKKIEEENIEFVLMDSLTSINQGSGYSPNDAEYGYWVYELKNLAQELGIAIILVHHTNKCPIEGGLDKIAGSAVITRAVSDIFLLSRSKHEGDPDTARVLHHLASRSQGQKIWKLEIEPEDFRYYVAGRCTLDGTPAGKDDGEERKNLESSLQIQQFLKENSSIAFEASEIAHQLNISESHCRRLCGDLSRRQVIARRKSARNPRARAYYWPEPSDRASDRASDRDHLHDHLDDHLENPLTMRDTTPSDRPIVENHPFPSTNPKKCQLSGQLRDNEDSSDSTVHQSGTFGSDRECTPQKSRSDDHLGVKPLPSKDFSSDHPSDHQVIASDRDRMDDHLDRMDDHLSARVDQIKSALIRDWGEVPSGEILQELGADFIEHLSRSEGIDPRGIFEALIFQKGGRNHAR